MLIDRVEELETKVNKLEIFISLLPDYIPLYSLKQQFNVKSPQTILRRLESHNFEPDKDYKKIGKEWHISIKALPKLKMIYT